MVSRGLPLLTEKEGQNSSPVSVPASAFDIPCNLLFGDSRAVCAEVTTYSGSPVDFVRRGRNQTPSRQKPRGLATTASIGLFKTQ